ncbi:MAG TPA: sensor domain-containing diguanylate cyclase [Pseudonocardiaceae bacterium]|nr:sensor domain-containing diguanylate cyclase [Pseudonocardiaceae bacterium]
MRVTDAGGATGTASMWAELVAGLPIGVLLQDEQGTVLASNDLAGELLGCTAAELRTGARPAGWRARDEGGSALPAPADLAGQVLRMKASLAIPTVVTRPDVPPVRLWVSYHPIRRPEQWLVLVALRPVHTDVSTAQGLLDPLTGLPNRTLLLDRLGQALIRADTHRTLVSLVLLDLCDTAGINARIGFRRGDDLLVTVAGRLREGLRADHTVARYAGDRFAVVAEHPTGTGEPIAARISELVGRSVRLGETRLRPTARVCWLTTDGSTPAHRVIAHLESRLAEAVRPEPGGAGNADPTRL